MARTTIKSTALDFNAIKNNLKTFLAEKDEFSDYNFEASGLSNILDVLAYNTHYNGLIANFALNESYLSTAQLRSSVVSLAEGIGYTPKSKTSARAVVNLSVNTGNLANRPATISLPVGTTFTSTVDDIAYTFQTREAVTARDDGTGYYLFKTAGGDDDIVLYEGKRKTKTFLVGADAQNTTYIIPDKSLDIETAIVSVYESATSTQYATYKNIIDATVINDDTTIYILREAPNEFYELSFGDGTTLGRAPVAGNKITVDYLSVAGPEANSARVFKAVEKVTPVTGRSFTVNALTVSDAVGGSQKETITSVRKNAPFQYASQNRMVTASDYSSLVLRNFSNLIYDIKAWGGEDALKPKFGTIFMSIIFKDDVPANIQEATKQSVLELAEQLSVVSFDLEFDDPVKTWIEAAVYFQFNPKLTTLSINTVQERVKTAINTYFNESIGKFEQSFRRSNLLTLIDEQDISVLSSRADIKMQQRIYPLLNKLNDFSLRFPSDIANPDDENHIITSSSFYYNGDVCNIRNKLKSNKLQVVRLSDLRIVVDNVGEFNPVEERVNIVGLKPDSIVGGDDFIKIKAVPANQSAISPYRNDVLDYDAELSFATGVTVTST